MRRKQDGALEIPSDCIDLIYLVPPFFSNKTYEVIWGDEAEVRSSEDRWQGGIRAYIDWMRQPGNRDVPRAQAHGFYLPALRLARRALPKGDDGLDLRREHWQHRRGFQNELVWCYEVGGRGKKRWARNHDIILMYSKGKDFCFNWERRRRAAQKRHAHARAWIDEDGAPLPGEDRRRNRGRCNRYYMDEGNDPPGLGGSGRSSSTATDARAAWLPHPRSPRRFSPRSSPPPATRATSCSTRSWLRHRHCCCAQARTRVAWHRHQPHRGRDHAPAT